MYGLIRGYAALIESDVSGGQVFWSAMVYSYTVAHNEGDSCRDSICGVESYRI